MCESEWVPGKYEGAPTRGFRTKVLGIVLLDFGNLRRFQKTRKL